jgi:hypothetical protein
MKFTDYGNFYQVSGSLPSDAPSYINREADIVLFENILAGKFSYILAPRQTGKSSLKNKTFERLKNRKFTCIPIDLTSIISNISSIEQFYYSFLFNLNRNLENPVNLREWWMQHYEIQPHERIIHFLRDIILNQLQGKLLIFIDEIDSILRIEDKRFHIDQFLSIIKECYDLRTTEKEFKRINFVISGVAILSQLTGNFETSVFAMGKSIELQNLPFDSSNILMNGLRHVKADPNELLKEIFYWTSGQPILTQKLCHSIAIFEEEITDIKTTIKVFTEYLFLKFDSSDEDQNLTIVQQRILSNEEYGKKMLEIYNEILLGTEVKFDKTQPAMEYLLLSGLVTLNEECLQSANLIYLTRFNADWAKKSLKKF